MLIVGSGGFAKEVLEILYKQPDAGEIVFYDDTAADGPLLLYDRFAILKNLEQAEGYFKKNDRRFVLGTGTPLTRFTLCEKFNAIGGVLASAISQDIAIGSFGNTVGEGVAIMQGVKITNSVTIGRGCLLNLNCTIGHDSVLGIFCEVSPGVHISGNCQVGDFCFIGTNASLLPGIRVGNNVVIGAGAVVTKDLPDDAKAIGVPARIMDK